MMARPRGEHNVKPVLLAGAVNSYAGIYFEQLVDPDKGRFDVSRDEERPGRTWD